MVAGIAYAAIGLSLWLRPPPQTHGQVAAADLAANTGTWAVVFGALGVLFLVVSWDWRRWWQHGIAATFVFAYGLASVASSVHNDTGWTVAALCLLVASGHYFTMKRGRRGA